MVTSQSLSLNVDKTGLILKGDMTNLSPECGQTPRLKSWDGWLVSPVFPGFFSNCGISIEGPVCISTAECACEVTHTPSSPPRAHHHHQHPTPSITTPNSSQQQANHKQHPTFNSIQQYPSHPSKPPHSTTPQQHSTT